MDNPRENLLAFLMVAINDVAGRVGRALWKTTQKYKTLVEPESEG